MSNAAPSSRDLRPDGLSHPRRAFLNTLALAGAGLATSTPGRLAQAATAPPRRGIKLGFDNFSIRAFGWKAGPILDYAATLKVDSVLFSDLQVYESHDAAYLKDLRDQAKDLDLTIQAGTYSICPTSAAVTTQYGTPEEHLVLAIRIAKALGSDVVRCVLGNSRDRQVEGGIHLQIAETVKVLKKVRGQAMDAGVKIAVENHAGDMQAWELVRLIEAAGPEFVGATLDSGNAAWTIEAPMVNLEILGPYAATTGIRDTAVWETEDGAYAQWTAVGEGNTEWEAYATRFAELCPNTVFQLEIISQYGRALPYLKPEFWAVYPEVRASEFARFIAFAKRGKPHEGFQVPAGMDRKEAERAFAKAQLERSVTYCRNGLGLGLKNG